MADEHDDDLEAEVEDGAAIETQLFPQVAEDDQEAELTPEKSDREERAAIDNEEEDASDTI